MYNSISNYVNNNKECAEVQKSVTRGHEAMPKQEVKTRRLDLSLPEAQIDRLQSWARQYEMSVQQLIRWILISWERSGAKLIFFGV